LANGRPFSKAWIGVRPSRQALVRPGLIVLDGVRIEILLQLVDPVVELLVLTYRTNEDGKAALDRRVLSFAVGGGLSMGYSDKNTFALFLGYDTKDQRGRRSATTDLGRSRRASISHPGASGDKLPRMRAAHPIKRRLASPSAAVFALALVTYAYFYQAGGWNQNVRFALVRALVEQHTARLDAYHGSSRDLSCQAPGHQPCAVPTRPDPARDEHYYCDKAPGAQFLAVPAYAVMHLVAGGPRPSPEYLAVTSFLVTVWSIGVPAALAVWMLYWLLAALGLRPWARAAVALAYGLGTLALPYATLYYGHQLAAALLLIGFALLVRARREPAATSTWWRMLLCGLALGGAVSVEYPAALAATAIGVYAAAFVRPWPRLGWLVAGAAIPALATAAYHWIVFGGPATLPYDFSIQGNRSQGWFMGLGVPAWEATKHLLFTGYRGLFYSSPWLLLALPGAVRLWRRSYRAEVAVCVAVFALFVVLNGSLVDWNGGWAFGARYLVPAIPFLAVLAAGVLLEPASRGWRAASIAGGLAAVISVFLMLVGTAVKPEVPDAYVEPPRHTVRIDRPFTQFLLPSFGRGELAVNSQGIHQAESLRRGNAFVGRRWAFNLGEVVGLRSKASLIPLVLLWGAGGWWLIWALRRRDE
jgi:hypothetical protein